VRLLGISLSNLNTEVKKTVVVQLKFAFWGIYLIVSYFI
jgi:DNA polymerase-4